MPQISWICDNIGVNYFHFDQENSESPRCFTIPHPARTPWTLLVFWAALRPAALNGSGGGGIKIPGPTFGHRGDTLRRAPLHLEKPKSEPRVFCTEVSCSLNDRNLRMFSQRFLLIVFLENEAQCFLPRTQLLGALGLLVSPSVFLSSLPSLSPSRVPGENRPASFITLQSVASLIRLRGLLFQTPFGKGEHFPALV